MFQIKNKEIELLGDLNADTLVIMQADHNEGEGVLRESVALGCRPFCLVCVSGGVWEKDLSPWPAPAVFKNGSPFGGEADATITELQEELLPGIYEKLGHRPEHLVIAGYSLAGLFALYTAYRSDLFEAVVSASGSLWYPNFIEFTKSHAMSKSVKQVYLSVGDKEAKTKNPVMQTVEDHTRMLTELLNQNGIPATFELNAGGHFVDDDKRLAKGIAVVL